MSNYTRTGTSSQVAHLQRVIEMQQREIEKRDREIRKLRRTLDRARARCRQWYNDAAVTLTRRGVPRGRWSYLLGTAKAAADIYKALEEDS